VTEYIFGHFFYSPFCVSHTMFRMLTRTERTTVMYQLPPDRELDRIITLQEAALISSVSPDSWKRNHKDKIVKLSSRRLGIRLRHALMLGDENAS
jgi:hypothetical protein